jgi:hypothetical protein
MRVGFGSLGELTAMLMAAGVRVGFELPTRDRRLVFGGVGV